MYSYGGVEKDLRSALRAMLVSTCSFLGSSSEEQIPRLNNSTKLPKLRKSQKLFLTF